LSSWMAWFLYILDEQGQTMIQTVSQALTGRESEDLVLNTPDTFT